MRNNIDAATVANRNNYMRIGRCGMVVLLQLAMVLAFSTRIAVAGEAKGSLSYKGTQLTLRHAYLVRGPDAVNTKQTIRRLILSAIDIGAKLQACKTMSCTDAEVTEGMTLDMNGGPRLNYWVAVNNQRVQYSGTEQPAALTARADDAGRLAGKLSFDNTAAGGPRVDIDFDAPLFKEFTIAH